MYINILVLLFDCIKIFKNLFNFCFFCLIGVWLVYKEWNVRSCGASYL